MVCTLSDRRYFVVPALLVYFLPTDGVAGPCRPVIRALGSLVLCDDVPVYNISTSTRSNGRMLVWVTCLLSLIVFAPGS